MTKRPSPPSAHDVARVAGVSQAAVSRAFTPGASIAKATREKVFVAAKAVGYRPNFLARSLISGKSGIVGVVLGRPLNVVVMAALDALSTKLSEAGKHILIFTADGHSLADGRIEDLLNYRVDVLLLMATNASPGLTEQCRAAGIPVICLNRQGRNAAGGTISITGNDRTGGWQIAEHLVTQGYRRLAVLVGPAESSILRAREAGFTAYLTAKGLPSPERETGYRHREGAFQAARLLLSRKSRPDAIFCTNDDMALAAIEVARYEFGLQPGRQLGIAGFDDIEQASWPSFDLTTYSIPIEVIIEKVVKVVVDLHPSKAQANTIVDGELRIRGSTRRKSR